MQLLENGITTEVLTNGEVSGYVYAWDDDGVQEQERDWLFARAVSLVPDRQVDPQGPIRQVDPQKSGASDDPVRVGLFNTSGERVGFVYARGNEPRATVDGDEPVIEHWNLFSGYQAAPGATVVIRPDDNANSDQRSEIVAQLIIENRYNRFERAIARLERDARIAS